MNKSHYTFFINGEDDNKLHNYISNSAGNVAKKIVNRYLRTKNDATVNLNLTVVNIETNKKYYYKVMCVKYDIPIYKRISQYKTIQQRYSIFIQKMPNNLIDYLKGESNK